MNPLTLALDSGRKEAKIVAIKGKDHEKGGKPLGADKSRNVGPYPRHHRGQRVHLSVRRRSGWPLEPTLGVGDTRGDQGTATAPPDRDVGHGGRLMGGSDDRNVHRLPLVPGQAAGGHNRPVRLPPLAATFRPRHGSVAQVRHGVEGAHRFRRANSGDSRGLHGDVLWPTPGR